VTHAARVAGAKTAQTEHIRRRTKTPSKLTREEFTSRISMTQILLTENNKEEFLERLQLIKEALWATIKNTTLAGRRLTLDDGWTTRPYPLAGTTDVSLAATLDIFKYLAPAPLKKKKKSPRARSADTRGEEEEEPSKPPPWDIALGTLVILYEACLGIEFLRADRSSKDMDQWARDGNQMLVAIADITVLSIGFAPFWLRMAQFRLFPSLGKAISAADFFFCTAVFGLTSFESLRNRFTGAMILGGLWPRLVVWMFGPGAKYLFVALGVSYYLFLPLVTAWVPDMSILSVAGEISKTEIAQQMMSKSPTTSFELESVEKAILSSYKDLVDQLKRQCLTLCQENSRNITKVELQISSRCTACTLTTLQQLNYTAYIQNGTWTQLQQLLINFKGKHLSREVIKHLIKEDGTAISLTDCAELLSQRTGPNYIYGTDVRDFTLPRPRYDYEIYKRSIVVLSLSFTVVTIVTTLPGVLTDHTRMTDLDKQLNDCSEEMTLYPIQNLSITDTSYIKKVTCYFPLKDINLHYQLLDQKDIKHLSYYAFTTFLWPEQIFKEGLFLLKRDLQVAMVSKTLLVVLGSWFAPPIVTKLSTLILNLSKWILSITYNTAVQTAGEQKITNTELQRTFNRAMRKIRMVFLPGDYERGEIGAAIEMKIIIFLLLWVQVPFEILPRLFLKIEEILSNLDVTGLTTLNLKGDETEGFSYAHALGKHVVPHAYMYLSAIEFWASFFSLVYVEFQKKL
jgi:hypothetical protein